jgi:hypothetical protein
MSASPAKERLPLRSVVDDPVIAYADWRTECLAVWTAYRHWTNAPTGDAVLAHAAYEAALDREDAAASAYARVIRRAGGSVGRDLAMSKATPIGCTSPLA